SPRTGTRASRTALPTPPTWGGNVPSGRPPGSLLFALAARDCLGLSNQSAGLGRRHALLECFKQAQDGPFLHCRCGRGAASQLGVDEGGQLLRGVVVVVRP